MSQPLLKCEHVDFGYENYDVVKDVSLEICQGDYLCIVGENGSGKSTLMKGLLGLLRRPVTLLVFGWFLMQLISLVTARKPLKTKRAVHVQIILIILAGLSIVLPSLSCVAVTQFRKDGLLPEWLNTMFVQIFVYSYVWAKHTVYLYPVIGSALRLLNVPAQQKPVCKDV